MNQLEPILAATREEVARRQRAAPMAELERIGRERLAARELRDFMAAVQAPGLSLIAEHKRRSPSAGLIRDGVTVEHVVGAYERAGAAAVSILTDGPSFGGSLDDLRRARAATALPLLRKDFIVGPYQVHESLAAGADAILLIVAALREAELSELHALTRELGLVALVEVHDRPELDVALGAGAELVGINNRDLTTLSVNTETTFELAPLLPANVTSVAESGFRSHDELAQLAGLGVDGVLVGEALMRAEDVEEACRALSDL